MPEGGEVSGMAGLCTLWLGRTQGAAISPPRRTVSPSQESQEARTTNRASLSHKAKSRLPREDSMFADFGEGTVTELTLVSTF